MGNKQDQFVRFWRMEANSHQNKDNTSLLCKSCDVAIIGGGFTGLHSALLLADHGYKVCLIERGDIGQGSSTRTAGFATTGAAMGLEEMTLRFGLEKAVALWETSLESIRVLEEVIRKEKIACHFQRNGSLILAEDQTQLASLEKQADMLGTTCGHPQQLLDQSALPAEINSNQFVGGLLDHASASLQPAMLVDGLASALRKRGTSVVEGCPAIALEAVGDGWHVETTLGKVTAKEVLFACNAYGETLGQDLGMPDIRKVSSYITATTPLPKALSSKLFPGNRLMFTAGEESYYFRLSPGGSLLFGSRLNTQPMPTPKSAPQLLRRKLLEFFPELKDIETPYSWHGFLGFSDGGLPTYGKRNGVWYATGYSGKGVAYSALLGTSVARKMLGLSTPSMDFFKDPNGTDRTNHP